MSLMMRFLFFTILVLLVIGQELSDVTVSYTDPQITYSGTWFLWSVSTCTTRATTMAGASATLRFRGVAIKIRGDYELTGIPVVLLDGVQYAIIPGKNQVGCDELVFEKSGLEDTDHTVEMKWKSSGRGDMMGLFSFTYTKVEASSSPLVAAATSSPPSSGDASASPTEGTASTAAPASAAVTGSSTSMSRSSVGTPAPSTSTASTSVAVSSTGVPGPSTEVALSDGNRRARTITGVSVGAVGALVLAALLFLGFEHILYSLTHLLFGWSAWKGRWLIFKAPAHLGPTQISLFLTNDDRPIDTEKDSRDRPMDPTNPDAHQPQPDKPVVWKVFDIGGARREFVVEIPCLPVTGNVKLGFATIEEPDPNFIRCQAAERAPARLDGSAWEHEGDSDEEKQTKKARKAQPKQTAKNMNDYGVRIALGTYHDNTSTVQPSLLVEQVPGDGGSYEAKEDFYIHAFRTNGYNAGQYGPTIFEDVDGDQLTPKNGIRISELEPLTSWYIESDSKGRLTVRIGRNSRKDVKEYRHKCKIEKDAIRSKSEERLPLIPRS